MKVHIEIEMTPQEARAAMGLPDVENMQAEMLAEMQERAKAAFAANDPDQMMRAWLPFWSGSTGGGPEAFEKFQKFFWDNAARTAAGGSRKDAKS